MKNTLIIILLSLYASLGMAQNKTTLPSKFFNTCWTAFIEEDQANSEIKNYTLCENRSLKPGVMRERFTFKNDGTCRVMIPDGTGTQYYVDCTWKLNESNNVVEINNTKGLYSSKFTVIDVKDDHLQIKGIK